MNIIIASKRPFQGREAKDIVELRDLLKEGNPEHIFFPYWSWLVPKEILEKYHCVGFHTGHIAGGSPIQNLIRQNINHTIIRMFTMNESIDGGEDIGTSPICLCGSLEEIIIRQTNTMKAMIDAYIQENNR